MTLAVALTPNVKGIVLSDACSESDVERNVFTAENIRQRAKVPRFDPIHLFLQLDCARRGIYRGELRISRELDEVMTQEFVADFEEDGGCYEGVYVLELDPSEVFREPGRYAIQILFHVAGRSPVLKGERSFDVVTEEPS